MAISVSVIERGTFRAAVLCRVVREDLLGMWLSENESVKLRFSDARRIKLAWPEDILIAFVDGFNGFRCHRSRVMPQKKLSNCGRIMVKSGTENTHKSVNHGRAKSTFNIYSISGRYSKRYHRAVGHFHRKRG